GPAHNFWITAPELEFICCLLRRIVKENFKPEHAARLTELFAQAKDAATKQIARFFPGADGALIEQAAASGDWRPVQSRLPALRPPLSSTIRALGYWLIYQTAGHPFTLRADRARCCLSLNDRHFVDTLVDPRRYRYTGPMRLLNWIWRISPKPDMLILLDAPAE